MDNDKSKLEKDKETKVDNEGKEKNCCCRRCGGMFVIAILVILVFYFFLYLVIDRFDTWKAQQQYDGRNFALPMLK